MANTQCSYCGRENDAGAVHCGECGTDLSLLPKTQSSPKTSPKLSPEALKALRATFGSILICTAIYYAAHRAFFDIQEIEHGGPLGKPGIYAAGMLFIPITIALGMASAFFTLVVFSTRTPTWQAFLGIIVALTVIALVFLRPIRGFWLPAFFIGRGPGVSVVAYIGPVIQLFLGGWILGWFDRWLRRRGRFNASSQYGAM